MDLGSKKIIAGLFNQFVTKDRSGQYHVLCVYDVNGHNDSAVVELFRISWPVKPLFANFIGPHNFTVVFDGYSLSSDTFRQLYSDIRITIDASVEMRLSGIGVSTGYLIFVNSIPIGSAVDDAIVSAVREAKCAKRV